MISWRERKDFLERRAAATFGNSVGRDVKVALDELNEESDSGKLALAVTRVQRDRPYLWRCCLHSRSSAA